MKSDQKGKTIEKTTNKKIASLWMVIAVLFLGVHCTYAQEEEKEDPTEAKSLAFYLNKEKTKYLWVNFLAQTEANFRNSQAEFNIKRAQLFLTAKVSDRIMLCTYLTTNSLNAKTLERSAQGNGNQVSLNGLYMDIDIVPGKFRVGAGLHYVNGISRLTNYSSFTSMTYDAPGGAHLGDGYYPAWWGYGYSDQFSSPLGVYAIGDFGKFHYQVSVNNSMTKNFASGETISNTFTYQSNYHFQKFKDGRASMNYQGYFEYQFLDKEWHEYTFRRGTYMGSKSVFNIGVGFFHQPNALIKSKSTLIEKPQKGDILNNTETASATSFAIDAFYDAPVGDGAINSYLAYYNNYFGKKGAVYGTGTGSIIYAQLGYVLPTTLGKRTRIMPYVTYMHQDFETTPETSYESGVGVNVFVYSHKLKFTPEYVFGKKGTTGAKADSYFRTMLTMSL